MSSRKAPGASPVQAPPAEAPADAPAASEGFPQVGTITVPALKRPVPLGDEALVLPVPKVKARRSPKEPSVAIEELLAPDPQAAGVPQERQQCLALMMKTTGHSLDWGCRLCTQNCVYATPCGCQGYDCIDRKQAEPIVVFEETPAPRRKRAWLGLRKASPVISKVARVWRVLLPWTWFRRRARSA